jgi:uncharacterized membrane protein YbaN (DUF454 family)
VTKVALLTIWREKNYGAELQAYATVRALKEIGVDVEMIDLRLSDNVKLSLKGKIAHAIAKYSKENRKFEKFWKIYIPTGRHYHSFYELRKHPPIADIYLVGSDQVWNPEITKGYAPAYFLDFGSENIKRVSYASSFGSFVWKGDMELSNIAAKRLRQFAKISCREATGIKILKSFFGISAQNVLDPIFLHKSYPELTGEIIQNDTLVYYPLSRFDEVGEICETLAEELDLKFVNANDKKFIFGKVVWDRPSIQQWLKSIAEASLVVTSSFHGLVLSILYKRQFIILQNSNYERSSRLTDLLEMLNLNDRYFTSVDDFYKAKPWKKRIDYAAVEAKLNIYATVSWSFFYDILKQ